MVGYWEPKSVQTMAKTTAVQRVLLKEMNLVGKMVEHLVLTKVTH